jgi:hypothetical protein
MGQCLKHSNNSTGTGGQEYVVYYADYIVLEDCPNNEQHQIILSVPEHTNLLMQANLVSTIDDGFGLIDPVEISAVYGTSFAMIFALSAIAYKIKVGKNLVKLM